MDTIEIRNDLFPEWIINLFHNQNNLRNESISDYFHSFPIPLEQYDLVCVGIRDNHKYLVPLKILRCLNNTPMNGAHEILTTHPERGTHIIEVPSLTYLKKHIFNFEDCLSFERCTFLILHDQQKLIRLKHIRGLISLPCCQPTTIRKRKNKITDRSKIQMNNLIRSIYTSFQRDLHGYTPLHIHNSFLEELQKVVVDITTELNNKSFRNF